jgi:hypothetical protein
MTEKEKKVVQNLMDILKCTEEDALDIIATDKIIDKGGRTKYDLPIEKEKEALKIGAVNDRKAKSADNLRGKVRAENPTKSGIIAEIAEFLTEKSNFACENVRIVNKERLIAFKCGENDYEFTLVQKRKPKS